jgi:pimeloyl-ACP methyl ester carboxylesterase
MHHVRRGAGPPLLLVHGLVSAWRTWLPILDALAVEREVIAVDLQAAQPDQASLENPAT